MLRFLVALLLGVLAVSYTLAQTHTITGYVRGAETHETLIGATVVPVRME